LCHVDIKERFLVASLLEMTDLKVLPEVTELNTPRNDIFKGHLERSPVTSNIPLSLRTHVRSLKDPSLCSGHGFLVASLLEMTGLKMLLEVTGLKMLPEVTGLKALLAMTRSVLNTSHFCHFDRREKSFTNGHHQDFSSLRSSK